MILWKWPEPRSGRSFGIDDLVGKRGQLRHQHRVEPFLDRKEDPGDVHEPELVGHEMDELADIGGREVDEHRADGVVQYADLLAGVFPDDFSHSDPQVGQIGRIVDEADPAGYVLRSTDRITGHRIDERDVRKIDSLFLVEFGKDAVGKVRRYHDGMVSLPGDLADQVDILLPDIAG